MTPFPLVARCRDCGDESGGVGPCRACGQAGSSWWCLACRDWFDRPCCPVCGGIDAPAVGLGVRPFGPDIPFRLAVTNRLPVAARLAVRPCCDRLHLPPAGALDFAPGAGRLLVGSARPDAPGDFRADLRIDGPAAQAVAVSGRLLACGLGVPRSLHFGRVEPDSGVRSAVLPVANLCDVALSAELAARGSAFACPLRAVSLGPRGTATAVVTLDTAGLAAGRAAGRVALYADAGEPALVALFAEVARP